LQKTFRVVGLHQSACSSCGAQDRDFKEELPIVIPRWYFSYATQSHKKCILYCNDYNFDEFEKECYIITIDDMMVLTRTLCSFR